MLGETLDLGPFKFLEASDRTAIRSFEMHSYVLLFFIFHKKPFMLLFLIEEASLKIFL